MGKTVTSSTKYKGTEATETFTLKELGEPNWVSRYVYSLIKLNQATRANVIIQELMNQKAEELKEASEEICDEGWTEKDIQEHINEL
jgi:hypothetical protein